MEPLKGYKTYLAAFGLICLGLYQLSQGQVDSAFQSFMGALTAYGLRQAINNGTAKT